MSAVYGVQECAYASAPASSYTSWLHDQGEGWVAAAAHPPNRRSLNARRNVAVVDVCQPVPPSATLGLLCVDVIDAVPIRFVRRNGHASLVARRRQIFAPPDDSGFGVGVGSAQGMGKGSVRKAMVAGAHAVFEKLAALVKPEPATATGNIAGNGTDTHSGDSSGVGSRVRVGLACPGDHDLVEYGIEPPPPSVSMFSDIKEFRKAVETATQVLGVHVRPLPRNGCWGR